METLNPNIGLFKLQIGKSSYEETQITALHMKKQLTLSNIIALKNDEKLYNGLIDWNTIIHYSYDSDGLGGNVYTNVEFRWNYDTNKLDTWYTLIVEYNGVILGQILTEIGQEKLLFSRIEKVLKQATIEFKECDEQVTILN